MPSKSQKDDLHSLTSYDKCDEFICEGINLDIELGAEVVDGMLDVPFIGRLLKLIKVTKIGYDYFFYLKKIAYFVSQIQDIPHERRDKFVSGMSLKMREKSAEYLCSVLMHAEDSDKAEILGLIYRARVLDEITDEMMLRLTSVINKIYVRDLRLIDLPKGQTCDYDECIISNFQACGIIEDSTGTWHNGPLEREKGSLSQNFNATGMCLYNILYKANWFNNVAKL